MASTPFTADALASLQERVLYWATHIRKTFPTWKTGIYPSEMATFLALCDHVGIKGIVESGRGPDAYSTELLGWYGDQQQVTSVSLDFAPIAEFGYGERLESFSSLHCLNGNSIHLLPRALRMSGTPAALLVDGPKGHMANNFSASAASRYPLRIVAHHNCVPGSTLYEEFSRAFPGAFHLEDLQLEKLDAWNEFKSWEKSATGGYEVEDPKTGKVGRSLDQSSLVMSVLPEAQETDRASRLQRSSDGGFRFSPWLLNLEWKIRDSLKM